MYKNNSFRKIDTKEINQCSMPSIGPPISHYCTTTVNLIRTKWINNQLDLCFWFFQQMYLKAMIIWASISRTIRSYSIQSKLIKTRIHSINWNRKLLVLSWYFKYYILIYLSLKNNKFHGPLGLALFYPLVGTELECLWEY